MDLIENLQRVPLFMELDPDTLGRLAECMRAVTFPAGTKVVEMGERGRSLFLIADGTVRVLYPSRTTDFELARLGPGEFFGEMALLNDKPRSATVQALGEISVMVLQQDDFQKIVLESPPVALKLLEALSVRIRNADEHISTLSDKAMRDPLTGLMNRRAFNERLKEEIDRAIRYGECFTLILIDLDRFKSVNDTFGHDVGDVILSWVGRLFGEHTRSADSPFRIGGEEFAIIAPQTPVDTALMVAQRLVDVVGEARPPVDFEMQVTMSAGFASCPDHGASSDQIFQIADRALLKAKEEGRNRVARPVAPEA